MAEITVTLDTSKSVKENLSEMIRFSEFIFDHDLTDMMGRVMEKVAEKKMNELISQLKRKL